MVYRAQSARGPQRRGNGNGGNGYRHHPSTASRIAIARATSRRSNGGGGSGGAVPLLAVLLVFTLVGVMATSVIAVGSAASVTFAQLEAGLPDVHQFEQLEYAQPTVVYARDGTTELARFQQEHRTVVTFDQLPKLVLDTTTATEDRTFWTNQGYDPQAIMSSILACLQGDCSRGGASTITQQFVRARLLPRELLAPGADVQLRKAKEIIQAAKLTDYVNQTYGPEEGKQRIITAYLNQIFYGHNAYGIAAAAQVYFGKSMADLTPAQAALLAGLPQSPSTLDPYKYAQKTDTGKYILQTCGSVPPPGCIDPPPIVRRNYVLRDGLAGGFGRWTTLSPEQLKAALDEPVVLIGEQTTIFKAPHFVWAMKQQLDRLLIDRLPAESGGYKVITTLDMKAQTLAERYITAAAIVPHLSLSAQAKAIRQNKLGKDWSWIDKLVGKGIYNASMSVLDYKTGDILAYVGSGGYYRDDLARPKFDPKYDVAGVGYRQPGSAWKPIMYATAFDERALTPGTVLLDVTTPFASSWDPKDADLQERGPVRVRKALQYSLNIPAIRAMDRVGPTAVGLASQQAGITFPGGPNHMEQAGLAGAIGTVEVRQLELTAAYGAFGNGGVVTEPRFILEVDDSSGNKIYDAGDPLRHRVWSPQAAWLVADILKGNTNPAVNILWGPQFHLNNGPNGAYRVAALKTGTTNSLLDFSTYGFLPKPTNPKEPAIALGVWMGNSDHRPPTAGTVNFFASDGPGKVWYAFLREYMKGKPVADFERPAKGLVQQTIDAFSGGKPGPWTRDTTQEWFIAGTEPGSTNAIDKPGLLYTQQCGQWFVDPVKAENPGAPGFWKSADQDWTARARSGTGVRSGVFGTTTAYFFGQSSWGGPIVPQGNCLATPSPLPSGGSPSVEPSGGPTIRPTRPPRATPTPDVTPRPTKKPKPTPTPAPTCHPHRPPQCTPPPPGGAQDTPPPQPGDGDATPTPPPQGDVTDTQPTNDRIPGSVAGLIQPAVLTEPVAAHPLRLTRKRRRRRPHR